ncbi:MAG: fasciclin domain-containing protein [Candidatus Zixiibacteriota bacterium]|jgi:uncharacterized surface protein with fasciclin (FAS1) repeats
MKKNFSKLMLALVAVFAIGVVGCSDSNNSNPVAGDLAASKMAAPNAALSNANSDMNSMKEKRTGPPIYGLANKSGLSILATAIEAVGLNKTLNTDGPFTVFAPTNEAFEALPEGTLEALLQDPEALTNILLYHVVDGEVMAADVVNLTEATMLNGGTVSIMVNNGGVMVNDANVIATDVLAKNGVVHVIDKVLIP